MAELREELKSLSTKVNNLEIERTSEILKLGEVKYAEIRNVDLDEEVVNGIILKIQSKDKEIFECRERIEEIKEIQSEKYCDNCDAEITSEDKFCKECGNPVNQVEDLGDPVGECSICANEFYEKDNYCTRCGNKVR